MLAARGQLGFNVKLLLETGEETGSPGLRAVCEREREALAADVLIASDGPRLRAERPTLFLGSRGAFNFDLTVDAARGRTSLRATGAACSPIPGTILANAIATLVDARGRILVEALAPAADSGCGARARWPTSCPASRGVRRSTPTGASRG